MKRTLYAKNLVTEETPISLIADNNGETVAQTKGAPTIGWSYILSLLVLIGALIIPQTRSFFLASGLRWVYVMLVSFAISFSLNPLCSWAAFKLGVLDQPDGFLQPRIPVRHQSGN